MTKKSEIELLEEISNKLDRLIMAVLLQNKDEDIQIKTLKKFGLSSSEVGLLMGLTSSAIRMRNLKDKKRKNN